MHGSLWYGSEPDTGFTPCNDGPIRGANSSGRGRDPYLLLREYKHTVKYAPGEIYYGRNGIRLSRALLSGSEVCGGGAPGTHPSSSINLRGPAVGKAISRTAS